MIYNNKFMIDKIMVHKLGEISMNWLNKFLMGRNGGDLLSAALLILSFFLTIISKMSNLPILLYLSYIPLAISVYRMFSKDIEKRRLENYKFSILISPIYSWFKKKEKRIKDSRTHKYFKCPSCKTSMRVPKGKGKLMVTCPNCGEKFQKKS